ncbi:hypothetical protein ASPWEDRAFT_119580 [Aspergillus wentii DTO 134E9]|uniref:Mitochondrial division protein 1 n=1 Tax=Aspergillus wentii DTO 134E9 TaxID=1073089 RepID=A0A1L9R979_ASPWE|nr:uncharacterized protein ASPWEDRAFT_119580 [Aspergillus wentii DTO 134E9]OJJ31438.1 hypothetical protein ASPWEDRAFT_119580 [Aspergillus wentii DTO 134E9]
MRLARQYSHSAVFRYIRNVGGIDDWKEMIATIRDIDSIIKDKLSAVSNDTVQDIKHAVSKLHEKMNSSLLLAAEARDDTERNERLLDSLPRVARAAYGFDHQDHGSRCLQGTQVEILQKIQDWTNDPSGKPILWLQGMAGTGKSTIARTVAAAFYHGYGLSEKELLPDEACLGGSFFFSHQDVNCRNPQKVFPTLVRDLIQVLPEMRDLVCDAIASHHDIHEQPLRSQWLHLVLNPLQTLSNKLDSPVTVVFVLDALDECEDSERIGEILGLFGQARNLEPLQVRVLATSRPERELFQNVKSGLDIRDEVLYKIRSSDGTEARKDDITRFVEHELENIRAKHDQHQSWPGDESIQRLVEKADGLFIYAATACRFLLNATKRTVNNRLKVILESRPNTGRIGSNPQYSLDEMYTRILEINLTGDSDNDEDMSALFKAVAGSIVVLSKRLAVHTLSNLIGIAHGDVEWMIEHLLSVLEVPANKQEPVQLLHLSFRDFLIDPQRCQNPVFQIDEKQANHRVMVYSLRVMSASLKRDICGLKKPGTNIKDIEPVVLSKCLPDHVQYACAHWIDHGLLCEMNDDRMYDFLSIHFTHWLESMCLMGLASRMIILFDNLLKHPATSQRTRDIVCDARRFTLNFRSIIENNPLQIYVSALLFAPYNTLIRTLFKKEIPRWISQHPQVGQSWSPLLQTIHVHGNCTLQKAIFSPDGSFMAVHSTDHFSVWDTATWKCLLVIHADINSFQDLGLLAIDPSLNHIKDLCFSPDSQELVVIWLDDTVQLLHIYKSQSIFLESRHPMHGPNALLRFSSDSEKIVYVSNGDQILVWQRETGELVQRILIEVDLCQYLSVSRDAKYVAVGYLNWDQETSERYNRVTVWDVSTGKAFHTHEAPGVCAVAFSGDGTALLSALENGALNVWDSATDALHSCHTESKGTWHAVFCSDGNTVTSFNRQGQIIWNWTTGSLRQIRAFSKTMAYIESMTDNVFTPQVVLPYSGIDHDRWAKNIENLDDLIGPHILSFRSIALSPDGKMVATMGKYGQYIQVWDTTTATTVVKPEGHTGKIYNLCHSPDGTWVASAGGDNTIRLWDAMTGLQTRCFICPHRLHPPPRLDSSLLRIAFSPDGKYLGGLTKDGVMRVWDVQTWAITAEIIVCPTTQRHFHEIDMSISRNIAAIKYDHVFDIWRLDPATRIGQVKTDREYSWVRLSPSGCFFVAGTGFSSRFRIWKTDTGELISTCLHEDSPDGIIFPVFAPDGETLISALESSIKIWETQSGELLAEANLDGEIQKLALSKDGRWIVTDQGRFQVESILHPYPEQRREEKMKGKGISLRDDWIRDGEEPILHIPPEYKMEELSIYENHIAMAHSERLFMIGFEEGEKEL